MWRVRLTDERNMLELKGKLTTGALNVRLRELLIPKADEPGYARFQRAVAWEARESG
jgi:hypothetical protein